ncbi:MAG: hypothetical protein H6Q07_1730 [Acidobacteria bacterium]|jgi:hypothetical protein|nr:hypothetical protein [Acidobacteriota bacterium]
MSSLRPIFPAITVLLMALGHVFSQSDLGSQLAELTRLKEKVADPVTNTRVDALHRVWAIGLASPHPEVKSSALDLLREPAGSASDHIRMPAVYAIAEIANSTEHPQIKIKALAALREPLRSSQVPIRDVAIDAVNSITRSGKRGEIALEAVRELGPPVQSVNNEVRIPAINAIVRAVEGSQNDAACDAAIDLLIAPLNSEALIGGMEVRMMAVAAMEKIGLEASGIRTKAKAMGLLQSYASKSNWESEASRRAQEAANKIEGSMQKSGRP